MEKDGVDGPAFISGVKKLQREKKKESEREEGKSEGGVLVFFGLLFDVSNLLSNLLKIVFVV